MNRIALVIIALLLVCSHSLSLAQSGDITMSVNITNFRQAGSSYKDIEVEITLDYPRTDSGLRVVDLNLSIAGGAAFLPSDAFTLSFEGRNASRTGERITPLSTRQYSLLLRPDANAIGVYALDIALSIDGVLYPELAQRFMITLGEDLLMELQGGQSSVFNAVILEPNIIDPDDVGLIRVLVRNVTDSDANIDISLNTFSMVVFSEEQSSVEMTWDLRAGEQRIVDVEYRVRDGAPYGRYTVWVSSSHASDHLSLHVPFGPFIFSFPIASGSEGVSNGVYLAGVPDPSNMVLSVSREAEILIWVENVFGVNEIRNLDVIVSDPTENLQMVPREGQLQPEENAFTVATRVSLGPQEGILLGVDIEAMPATVAGVYSLNIGATQSDGIQNDIWIPLQLSN